MAAPSYKNSIQWGSVATGDTTYDQGKLGLYFTINNISDTQTTVTTEIWFHAKYWELDSYTTLYADWDATSASTSQGNVAVRIDETTNTSTGSGWHDDCMILLKTMSKTYTRASSASTKSFASSLTDMDEFDNVSFTVTGTFTIPAVPTTTNEYLQIVYVRYQNADASWGEYSQVINQSYTEGSTVSWSRAADVTYKAASILYTVTDTATHYADVYRNEYPIHFNSNGGVYTPPSQYYIYGGTTKLSTHRPTRSGYKFLGWAKNGETANIQPNENITFDNSEPTLYAIWEKTNQDIYLYKDGKCYANEIIEEDSKGFGVNGEIYNTLFDETNYNTVFEIDNTSFIASFFEEGLPS